MRVGKLLIILGLGLAPLSAHADIVIGLPGPMTGKSAIFGEQMKRGAEQAAKDINAAGGINGEKLILKFADDACDPKQAVAAANQLISEGVKYVVGHYCSGSAIPASKVYMDENVLFITPAATNPKLTDEANGTVFRVCGRDDKQGVVVGQYLAQHYVGKKIVVAHDNSAYGRGLVDEVKKTINAAGVKEVAFEAYTPGERDYSALVSKIKQVGADVVFIGGYHTEIGLIARQMRTQGVTAPILGGDSLVTDELWSIAGTAAEGMLMTFGPDPRNKPEAKKAIDALRASGFEPEGYTLYTYAAVQVMAAVARNAGKDSGIMAAEALHKAMVPTVMGNLSFDAKGDVAGPTYVLYQWHNGKYAEVQP